MRYEVTDTRYRVGTVWLSDRMACGPWRVGVGGSHYPCERPCSFVFLPLEIIRGYFTVRAYEIERRPARIPPVHVYTVLRSPSASPMSEVRYWLLPQRCPNILT